MSRILEFQHSDEQTVIARVLLELHQAIDANFPNANQSNRQFAKTILTSQTEATRGDGKPNTGRNPPAAEPAAVSMTPKSGMVKSLSLLGTDDIRTIMGDNQSGRKITKILWVLLFVGALYFLYLFVSANKLL